MVSSINVLLGKGVAHSHTFVYTVISHLSVGDHAVDEEAFQSTMKYIFSFIEKVSHLPFISCVSVSVLT